MRKKRVFLLINSLEGGGAERVVTTISYKLSEKYDVDLITLKNVNFYELASGVNHIPLSNVRSNLFMFFFIPYYLLKFKKLLRKNKYSSGMSFLEIANFINILSNKNAIISFRTNISFFSGIIGNIYKFLIKVLYPRAKRIIVNSEENRYDLAEYLKIPCSKIETIHNPIDIDKIEKLREEKVDKELLDKIKGKKVFITVGRLVGQKNHEKIINSFSKILDKNWIYLIVGDGMKRKSLEKQVLDLGLQENIIFLGNQKNIFKYLNISNYFLYASQAEGFPNVLIESMACNLPIITSNFVSGAKECIMGSYSNDLEEIKYPYYGCNGVLLDLKNYENDFLEVYKNLDKVNQKKVGFEKFLVENTSRKFEDLLING